MPPRSSFRLADNSRFRRRRLVLRVAAELEEKHARRLARAAQKTSRQDPVEPELEETVVVQATESVGVAVPELVGSSTATRPDPDPADDDDVPALRAFDPGEEETDGPDDLSTIRELVAGPRPATWVFCGDGPAETAFPEQFATELRITYHRPLDVVVNTLVPGSPIEAVLENLEWRLARFHPDVVNLVIGPAAASAGSGFAATLAELVDQMQELGAAVVLHVPATDGSDDLETHVDQIRNLASERAIPLVDHVACDNDHDRVERLCQALKLQRPGS